MDFKTGLNFYSGPFSFYSPHVDPDAIALSLDHKDSILAEELLRAPFFKSTSATCDPPFRKEDIFLLPPFNKPRTVSNDIFNSWRSK